MKQLNITKLRKEIKSLYLKHSKKLLFHGWHHITFVVKKSQKIAVTVNANKMIVEAAALTHDLNYIIKPNSKPEIGKNIRKKILLKTGFNLNEIIVIEKVVMESHTGTRTKKISPEGIALSDADTLFKALPITPIIFAQKYITQNNVDIFKLAKKITTEQNPLIKNNIYFYSNYAKKKYLHWAKDNLKVWNNVIEALKDKEIKEVLKIAKDLKVL